MKKQTAGKSLFILQIRCYFQKYLKCIFTTLPPKKWNNNNTAKDTEIILESMAHLTKDYSLAIILQFLTLLVVPL